MGYGRQASLQKNLQLRARIIQAIRSFFVDRDYLEVETPIRIPAPAPEAHIDAVASGDADAGAEAFRRFCSCLDKAAKKGVIKKNTATRSKSRAAARLRTLSA